MIKIDIKSDGERLLKTNARLYPLLIEIPDKRKIEFREEFENGKWFAKPRFKEPKYTWESQLYKELRNHLQEIWFFFEKYNYWFDDTLSPLISYKKRRISKKSIIFLLERDIWETDEVYGKYLIEKGQNSAKISYFRFDTKINTTVVNFIKDFQIQKWILDDAVRQIKEQFEYLWSRLEDEIKLCMEEDFTKKPKISITNDYLKRQLELTINLSNEWPEASLLSLGRICEMWLLLRLNLNEKKYGVDLIRRAWAGKIIDKQQKKLLGKIKRNYNYLKHRTYYQTEKKLIKELMSQFKALIV